MRRKGTAVLLALTLIGISGMAAATHYRGTEYVETAVRDYEAQTSPLATHNDDPIGITSDGSIDTTGVIFFACAGEDTPGGLRCNKTDDLDGDGQNDSLPKGPYDQATTEVTDQVTSTLYILMTSCSADGDNVCGETDNVNETGPTSGPNELRQGACTPASATIARDPFDPTDGTGDGVWNQTGEMYDLDGDGQASTPHPGVEEIVVFVLDPIWEAAFTDDACNGVSQWATQGTVELTGT